MEVRLFRSGYLINQGIDLKFATEQLKFCLRGVIICERNENVAICAKPVVLHLEIQQQVLELKASEVDCHLFTVVALYGFISTTVSDEVSWSDALIAMSTVEDLNVLIAGLHFHDCILACSVLVIDVIDLLFAKRALALSVFNPSSDALEVELMITAVQSPTSLVCCCIEADHTGLGLLCRLHLGERLTT